MNKRANATDSFLARIDLWKQCLAGGDQNCVTEQLFRLMWHASAYRVVNEARTLAPEAEDGGVELSPLLHTLIDDCFWDSQVLGVRRLQDKGSLVPQKKGDHSVYSLVSILEDMRLHAPQFTRENLFLAAGLEYDPAGRASAEEAYIKKSIAAGETCFRVPDDVDPFKIHNLHRTIDSLCLVNPRERQPDDVINPEIFSNLKQKVNTACSEVSRFANKYRAHAATPSSRSSGDGEVSITFEKLRYAHESLSRTCRFISIYLLNDVDYYSFLSEWLDPFLYIDRPLVRTLQVQHLRTWWDEEQEQVQNWKAWEVCELIGQPDSVNDL